MSCWRCFISPFHAVPSNELLYRDKGIRVCSFNTCATEPLEYIVTRATIKTKMTTQRTELNCINKFHTIYWIFTRFGTRTSDGFTAILLQSVTPVISFLYVCMFFGHVIWIPLFSHFHCTVDNVTAFGIYAIMRSIYSSLPWIYKYARLCTYMCFFGV